MRNPEFTRNVIIETASALFNKHGYKATSISDITNKAQVTKGAIYSHFKDKSELEKEALIHMSKKMLGDVAYRIAIEKNAKNKLLAILNYFEAYEKNPPFESGCPLMNASIEADDSNPTLKAVVKSIMETMHISVCKVLKNGIKHKQIDSKVDVPGFASFIISSLEGGVLMLKMMDNVKHLKASTKFLRKEIDKISI